MLLFIISIIQKIITWGKNSSNSIYVKILLIILCRHGKYMACCMLYRGDVVPKVSIGYSPLMVYSHPPFTLIGGNIPPIETYKE